jgi:Putative transposase/Transposase zinc-binding domain
VIALAELIERFEPALLQCYHDRLLPSQHQALAAMKRCRTRFAPRMLAVCAACGEQRSVPHSCGHRACPHCQHHEGQRWLQRQLQLQVPATYFLITFTLPAELRSLAWSHQRVVYALLMQCAWDTLATFSSNDSQLRATPGAVGVLHTHNRRLDFHPHVHMVMPAAALDTQRKLWRTKKRPSKSQRASTATGGYLFNHKALAKVFRAKVLDAIEHAALSLPAALPATWVVHCKAVGDGRKALLYLGRYLYRGVIQESDIVRCDNEQVTFRYRDAKTGRTATRTLPGADFLWLLLQHVLPKGLRRARNFGFLHPNSVKAIGLLQLLHLRAAPAAYASAAPSRPVWRCACGQPMHVVRRRMPALQPDPAGQAQPWRALRPDRPDPQQAHTMH